MTDAHPVLARPLAAPEPALLPCCHGEPIGRLAEKRGDHVKYMLMFCDRPHDADADFDDGLVARYVALQEEAERNGTFVTGAPLAECRHRRTRPSRRG